MKAKVGVSRRHVHLTKETFNKLFGDIQLEVRNYLGESDQFASTETVDIKANGITIEKFRIVGPFREKDQIEISQSDADMFCVTPPRKMSGDLEGTLPVTIIGPLGEKENDNGLIMVERHLHMTFQHAEKLGYKQGDKVKVFAGGKEIMQAVARIEPSSSIELHIDTDEEEEFNLHNGDEIEIK